MEKLDIMPSEKAFTRPIEEQMHEQVLIGCTLGQRGGGMLDVAQQQAAGSQLQESLLRDGSACSGIACHHALCHSGCKSVANADATAIDASSATRHPGQHRRSAVELIADLLQQLRPEARSQVIATHLKQWQRLELERFMVQKRRVGHYKGSSLLGQGKLPPQYVAKASSNPCVRASSIKVSSTVQRQCVVAAARDKRQPFGVCTRRHNGLVKYRASMSVSGLRIEAAPRTNPNIAAKDYERLVEIREHIEAGHGDFEARVRHALHMERANVSGCDRTGLIFHVASCGLYRKVLLSPMFREEELENALEAWRKLYHARIFGLEHNSKRRRRTPAQMQESWEHIRTIQAEMWCKAGANSYKVQQRLDKHENVAASRLEREWERWNREAMCFEDNRTRACQRRDRQFLLAKARRVRESDRIAKREAKALRRLDKLIGRWTPIRHCKAKCSSRRRCKNMNRQPQQTLWRAVA